MGACRFGSIRFDDTTAVGAAVEPPPVASGVGGS
jgi:hypothetical protein